MVAGEELLLELTPYLKSLSRSVEGMALPGDQSCAELFAAAFSGKNGDFAASALNETALLAQQWPVVASKGRLLWTGLFEVVDRIEHARFYFVDGAFILNERNRFDAEVGFEGLARTADGALLALKSKQTISWTRAGDQWLIESWVQSPMQVRAAPVALFQEVLGDVIPDEQALALARKSQHERNIIDLFTKDKFTLTKQVYADFLDLDSTFQHPGLAVVDYDQDGWDDLYVMGRWGANQMLHNRGDGTFEDTAASIGLNLEGLCTSAIFADFDNDGDPDVIVGRSLERSVYFANEAGRFVDRTEETFGAMPLPYLVSSISAVDYNNDGLLDIYLGLYGPPQKAKSPEKWARRFFPPKMADEILARSKESHRYVHRVGPPNLLLVNKGGGRFAVAPEAAELAEWHDTHQSVWSDFDGDGDQDVYVCNDFAPDHLYRNEGPRGPGQPHRFVDVSEQFAAGAMQGFGMGASWGDYDRDGALDLYVSNMFSKAGRRITDTVEGLDPRVPHSAQGNLLFRNAGERFDQVAGLGKEDLRVAKVGWAYGAQFLDFDNDGWLDIYSASGFYTAPGEIATEVDL